MIFLPAGFRGLVPDQEVLFPTKICRRQSNSCLGLRRAASPRVLARKSRPPRFSAKHPTEPKSGLSKSWSKAHEAPGEQCEAIAIHIVAAFLAGRSVRAGGGVAFAGPARVCPPSCVRRTWPHNRTTSEIRSALTLNFHMSMSLRGAKRTTRLAANPASGVQRRVDRDHFPPAAILPPSGKSTRGERRR